MPRLISSSAAAPAPPSTPRLELDAILEIGDLVHTERSLRDIFPALVGILRRVVAFDVIGLVADDQMDGAPPLVYPNNDNVALFTPIVCAAHAYAKGQTSLAPYVEALASDGGAHRWICVPLTADDRSVVGVLAVASSSFVDEGTVAFVACVSRHLARLIATHNSGRKRVDESAQRASAQRALLAEERIARNAAESAAKASASLGEVTALVLASLDPLAIVRDLSRTVSAHFACTCAIEVHDDSSDGHLAEGNPSLSSAPELAALLAPLVTQIVRYQRVAATGLPELRADDLILPETERLRRELSADWLVSAPITLSGRVRGAFTVFGSVSRQHRAGPIPVHVVEQLAERLGGALDNARLYSKALRAVHDRDQVLSTVSHDLKNPLGVILMSAAQILGKEGPTGLEASSERRRVEAIQRNARRMGALVTDLLDFGSMEAGALSMCPARHNPRRIIGDALEDAKSAAAAEAAGITLSVDLQAERLPSVWADTNRIHQVLSNIIGNAIKFTPRGGQIVVGARLTVSSEVSFSVTDSGRGIAAQELPHVFERYWQSKPTEATGSGLGLAICKSIVELSRGRIWVQSTPGQGTVVTFTLPIAMSREGEEDDDEDDSLGSMASSRAPPTIGLDPRR